MTITLSSKLPNDPEIYFTESFRQVIEDHLTYLKNHESSEMIEISNQVAHKFHGDLTGVLQSYNIPMWMHWTIMRMNNMNSVSEYRDDIVILQVPLRETLTAIMKIHRITQ